MGLFTRIKTGLGAEAAGETTVMIGVSRRTPCVRVKRRNHLKAHRTASSLRVKRGKLIGRDEHAVADAQGGAIRMAVIAGPVGDGTGAAAMFWL